MVSYFFFLFCSAFCFREIFTIMCGTYSGMLFKMGNKITRIQKATGFSDFRNGEVGSTKQDFGMVDTVICQVVVWCYTHDPSKETDKMIFGNRNIFYDVIYGYGLPVMHLDIVHGGLYVFGVSILLMHLFRFQNSLKQDMKYGMHRCRAFRTTDDAVVKGKLQNMKKLLLKGIGVL